MGTGPVAVAVDAANRSWKLKDEPAKQTQGLVVSPFSHLPAAAAVFLDLSNAPGGAWLKAVRDVIRITDATGKDTPAAAIAFTWTGLQKMKLGAEALTSFSTPFREGMHQVDRQRRLGDLRGSNTVIEGGPVWSGNTHDANDMVDPEAATPTTVHALLLLYAVTDDTLDGQVATVTAGLEGTGVVISRNLRLSLRFDKQGVGREHFGFADGISQPVPIGDAIVSPTGPGAAEQHQWHGVAAGEILLGHRNAHNEPAPGPLVRAMTPPGAEQVLPEEGATEGFRNLGLNGSYLVVREMRQNVAGFWQSMDAVASRIKDPGVDAKWLAERVLGRTMDGDPLASGGVLPRMDDQPANNFGFVERDTHGLGCPIGSHMRRANPRDGLPSRDSAHPDLSAGPDLLHATKQHRILRRARKFGPDIADVRTDDKKDRGLLFMCLNTDLVRHFEFVQQNWLLNQSFATLFNESDPLLGPKGPFTIPATPLRQCPVVETNVQFAGGEYFFLPSIPALDYLAGLPVGA